MSGPRASKVDEVIALLRTAVAQNETISAQLAALPAAIAAAVDGQHLLSPADEAALVVLLPVIAKVMGEQTFTVRMLHERAELDGALASIGSRKKIGCLLRRGAGFDIGDYRLVKNAKERDGRSWLLLSKVA